MKSVKKIWQEIQQKLGHEIGQEIGLEIGHWIGHEIGQNIGHEIGQVTWQKKSFTDKISTWVFCVNGKHPLLYSSLCSFSRHSGILRMLFLCEENLQCRLHLIVDCRCLWYQPLLLLHPEFHMNKCDTTSDGHQHPGHTTQVIERCSSALFFTTCFFLLHFLKLYALLDSLT